MIMEAIFVNAMAGYLGLVCGVGLLEVVSSKIPGTGMFRNPSINLGTALWATAVLVVAGGLAGLSRREGQRQYVPLKPCGMSEVAKEEKVVGVWLPQ